MSTDIRQFVNVELGRPQLDVARRRFIFPLHGDVGGEPSRGVSVGYFGRDSIVQLVFAAFPSDWNRYDDVRLAIVDSFHFDPDKAYSVELAAANRRPIWERALGKALGVSAVLAILAAIAAWKRKMQ